MSFKERKVCKQNMYLQILVSNTYHSHNTTVSFKLILIPQVKISATHITVMIIHNIGKLSDQNSEKRYSVLDQMYFDYAFSPLFMFIKIND